MAELKNTQDYNRYIANLKVDFEKAALSVAKKLNIPVSKDLLGFSCMLYESLFLNRSLFWQKAIIKFAEKNSKEKTEKFLSMTFYIFLNKISKFLYDNKLSWSVMREFYKAMDQTISYLNAQFVEENDEKEDSRSESARTLTPSELIKAFEKALQKDPILKLYNTYKGIPIEKSAKLIAVSNGTPVVEPHPLQEAAAMHQKKIFLRKNNSLPYDMEAKFEISSYLGKRVFKLKNIKRKNLINRKYIRIKPQEPLFARVDLFPKSQIMKVDDISLGGLSLIKETKHLFSFPKEVAVYLPISPKKPIEVYAHLIKATKTKEGFKYHFNIELDKNNENALSEFIAKNQLQIIQELKENFAMSR